MMMVLVNHALSAILSPMGLWFLSMLFVAVCVKLRWRRTAFLAGVLATAFLWAFSCGWMCRILGGGLERMYPPAAMETVPKADVILILGGGMGGNPEVTPYAEMYSGADRVWHAARLWKAGKAPVVMASGTNEVFSTKPLLLDFGIPESAIRIENEARNTEENAKCVVRLFTCPDSPVGALVRAEGRKPRVLLVTSAWHMRRAKLMFERYAPSIDVIAAPCDHEALLDCSWPLSVGDFFPGAEALARNGVSVKEIVGYWGYRWFRR